MHTSLPFTDKDRLLVREGGREGGRRKGGREGDHATIYEVTNPPPFFAKHEKLCKYYNTKSSQKRCERKKNNTLQRCTNHHSTSGVFTKLEDVSQQLVFTIFFPRFSHFLLPCVLLVLRLGLLFSPEESLFLSPFPSKKTGNMRTKARQKFRNE